MNQHTLKGNWKQTKGRIKKAWGELTDDEIEKIEGSYDKFVGTVQAKYGYTIDKAREQVNQFLDRLDG